MLLPNRHRVLRVFEGLVIIFLIIFITNKIMYWPQYSFVVEFDDVPAISDKLFLFNIDVHFRGYDVGDVTKVELSQDQSKIRFFVDIHYKGLKIPKNSKIIFKTENIYGTRYLDIDVIEPHSNEIIKTGEVLEGLAAQERLDQYLIEELTTGHTGSLIHNLYEISEVVKDSMKNEDNKKFLTQSSGDLAVILENFREIMQDPQVKYDLKSTIKHSSGTLRSVDEILRKKEIRKTINQTPSTINKTLSIMQDMNVHMDKVGELMPEATKNMGIANDLIAQANTSLGAINNKVPPIPPSLVENAEKLVVKTDCFESEISKLLSKRGLIARLIFGNPGKSFKTCAKDRCIKPKNETILKKAKR